MERPGDRDTRPACDLPYHSVGCRGEREREGEDGYDSAENYWLIIGSKRRYKKMEQLVGFARSDCRSERETRGKKAARTERDRGGRERRACVVGY